MRGIKWIFFDVGSTLVDETRAYEHRLRDMLRGSGVSYAQFIERRDGFAKAGFNGDQKAIERFGLRKTPWHSEDETPYEDALRTLECLSGRGYRLGVIANQEPGAAERLARWGLAAYIDVVAASAELGVAKPDPEIFLRALRMAGCDPSEAVMVGDRIDNDVAPANALGMTTVRIRQGAAAFRTPGNALETPDCTVDRLYELTDIFL